MELAMGTAINCWPLAHRFRSGLQATLGGDGRRSAVGSDRSPNLRSARAGAACAVARPPGACGSRSAILLGVAQLRPPAVQLSDAKHASSWLAHLTPEQSFPRCLTITCIGRTSSHRLAPLLVSR